MLTPDQEKLKEAALAATPGPWEQGSRSSLNVPHQVIAGEGSDLMVIMSGNQNFYQQAKLDAAYVAAANPAAILAILAQLEQVQGDAARLDWLEGMANEPGGLLLHDGADFTGRTGLGLRRIGRTLRQAVDQAAPQPLPPPEAA